VSPTTRHAAAGIALALLLGAALRLVWLTADPPAHGAVGIVWHDEGAWAHNARNRALWGTWRTDAWNPVFVAPVFTALEYAAFREFGVGSWQARLVPVASGLFAVAALAIGLWAAGGGRAAMVGAWLLATNYVFVMWNRAALMESTMTAFIVAGWAAYAMTRWRPAFGYLAGTMVTLAWFTKAAAAFFVAAIVFDALLTLALARSARLRAIVSVDSPSAVDTRGAVATLAGLAASAACVVVLFVLPHWSDYRFYNWQMSVTRKPSYTIRALMDRISWLPFVQGFFSRMWAELVAASLAALVVLSQWRRASPAERLLVLWLLAGFLELAVHDAGNERRYVMLIPALIGLAALLVGRTSTGTGDCPPYLCTGDSPQGTGDCPRYEPLHWLAVPVVVFLCYLVIGTAVRLTLLPDVVAGQLSLAVRMSVPLAVVCGVGLAWVWRRRADRIVRDEWPAWAVASLVLAIVSGDLAQFGQWAVRRTTRNYEASLMVGRLLPAGTLVHGKLANGMSLDNRIRPVFVGNHFGNYDDRTSRDDVRYVLTYASPYVGYEGRVIRDVLAAYPHRAIVARFEVTETSDGDRAILVDKFGARDGAPPAPALPAIPASRE
jgi:hypothetical protein